LDFEHDRPEQPVGGRADLGQAVIAFGDQTMRPATAMSVGS